MNTISTKEQLEIITRINKAFSKCFAKAEIFKSTHITSDLDQEVSRIITKEIPEEINKLINNSDFLVYGSVGKGLATKTPWVAILDKEITTSTREGVYLVFLFASDYKHVYLTLNQGTTVPGSFGPRLSIKTIANNTQKIRQQLSVDDSNLFVDNDADIADKRYKAGAIYYTLWDINDAERGKTIIDLYLDIYKKYKNAIINPVISPEVSFQLVIKNAFSIKNVIDNIQSTGLLYSDTLVKRVAFSLMSKRFLILSGLAGSGKTQLAIAFASTLVENKDKQMRVVSVGADWTNREPLLGFPNALRRGQYIKPESGVLDLLIEANREENSDKPFFLILDEMNMSYVERYFADFLSAMESKEGIRLWSIDSNEEATTEIDGIPQSINLPQNLFVIGTINVDETTYMFSPKVLDRANVIEFKISAEEMKLFLQKMREVDLHGINGKASGMGADFVAKANMYDLAKDEEIESTLLEFFRELKKVNAEFGYRSVTEIFRFICQAKSFDDTTTKLTNEDLLDAAIVQKLLPKLHGSRKKLVPVLSTLWEICETGVNIELAEGVPDQTKYPLTADKLLRMYHGAIDNGFTSFAEA